MLSGHFGPAIALVLASYTGCNPALTVTILSVGVGLNGAIYSGFKVNHLDISPRFAGILMSFTNFTANMAGLLAPIIAGYIIHGRVREIFIYYKLFDHFIQLFRIQVFQKIIQHYLKFIFE